MGHKFQHWQGLSDKTPESFAELQKLILKLRRFTPVEKLDYGDFGLSQITDKIICAITEQKKIALYADYDVDGVLSLTSWLWFFQTINFTNHIYYIPDRQGEGYGVNLAAIKHLIHEAGADLIITMDTGITSREEAKYCSDQNVEFICTDHHEIQEDKVPSCLVLNPKYHPDSLFHDLCGCGITFVLLRKLGSAFFIPQDLWTDLLALVGIATICDVVPLNGINHRLVKMGLSSLAKSKRKILTQLRKLCDSEETIDERDVGFRIGPRINAVGRLEHAKDLIEAFSSDDPLSILKYMDSCNEKRRSLQDKILEEARGVVSKQVELPIIFLGGPWHTGVLGIVASKLTEEFNKPTWLFNTATEPYQGSARTVDGFDISEAMQYAGKHFKKYGGHKGAGGFTFAPDKQDAIHKSLLEYAAFHKEKNPDFGQSKIFYDCLLPERFLTLELVSTLDSLKPFGHEFEEPRFLIQGYFIEKRTFNNKIQGKPSHTALFIRLPEGELTQKVMFFSETLPQIPENAVCKLLVSASKNKFQGTCSLTLKGHDIEI